ncbi:MAG: hypothetical protein C0603_06035 [Denitrovibrio sp.]|nr:MAG: hypothetical protein C0603_06035 [Denitrovibrio sp.]
MYTTLNAQSVSVRMSYYDQQTPTARTAQATEVKDQTAQTNNSKPEGSSSFADVLSLARRDAHPIENFEAYVQDSVNKVLEQIAEHASKVLSDQAGEFSVSLTRIDITIEMDEGETLQDVKSELDELLSEDGYWGVDKTSQRMFDFATAYAGDDLNELEKARDAVTKGFKKAEAMFGGKLPDISYDTYEATMSKFDEHIQNINNSLESSYV